MGDPLVLHVLEALEGGTARHVLDLVRHVDGYQHHVAIPSKRVGGLTDEHAARRMRHAGATVHIVEMRRRPVAPRNARAVVRLRTLIRTLDPQIVHGHSSIGGALARVAASVARRPCIYTPNGLATGRAAIALERLLARRTAMIIAVSPTEADVLRDRHIISSDRIAMIPNGIDVDPPAPGDDIRSLIGVPAATPLVGTVARLVAQKAPERFVALAGALRDRHPDTHFVLVGDGILRAQVDRAVAVARVASRFHRVPQLADAAAVVGQFDVFVLPSRFEGGPYAPLEAMRAGVPVVLTDVVGNRDVVEHGISGFLVPEMPIDEMARTVGGLLADPGRRAAVGHAGRDRVREHFDVVKTSRAVAAVYGSVVA